MVQSQPNAVIKCAKGTGTAIAAGRAINLGRNQAMHQRMCALFGGDRGRRLCGETQGGHAGREEGTHGRSPSSMKSWSPRGLIIAPLVGLQHR